MFIESRIGNEIDQEKAIERIGGNACQCGAGLR